MYFILTTIHKINLQLITLININKMTKTKYKNSLKINS